MIASINWRLRSEHRETRAAEGPDGGDAWGAGGPVFEANEAKRGVLWVPRCGFEKRRFTTYGTNMKSCKQDLEIMHIVSMPMQVCGTSPKCPSNMCFFFYIYIYTLGIKVPPQKVIGDTVM